MPEGVWKIFVSLGVPGLALGVFYALLRVFSWDLSALNPMIQVGLVVFFLFIVAGITLMSLRMWRPSLQGRSRSSVRIGSGSIVGNSIAGRDLTQGLINSKTPKISDSNSESSVEIGNSASILGSIAGRDILINHDRLPDRTEELSKILEDRATRIKAELAQHFRYAPVQEFLKRFDELHASHVDALRQGHLVRAHEILNEIHELSFKLQEDEFWKRHCHETPDLLYNISRDSFQRGYLIEWYVGSKVMEELVKERTQERRRVWSERDNAGSSELQNNASQIYSMIFNSDKQDIS